MRVAVGFSHFGAVHDVAADGGIHGVALGSVLCDVVGNPEVVFAHGKVLGEVDVKRAVGTDGIGFAEERAVLFAPGHLLVLVDEEFAVVGGEIGFDALHVGEVGGHDVTLDGADVHAAGETGDAQGGAHDGLVRVADAGGHLALLHGCGGEHGFGVAGVYGVESPERGVVFSCAPANDDGTGLLGVEFHAAVLDGEEAVGRLDGVDVVGFFALAELGGSAGAGACRADVVTVVVLDGELAVLFPEAPDAVGREGLVAEAHAVLFCIVVHHLAGAVGIGGSARDVVPVLVAFGADDGRFGHVLLDVEGEVGEHDALAVGAGEREADAGECHVAGAAGGCGL